MSLATKAYLFKVFIRPVIHYDLDVFNLNECQNDEIKSTETIILKQILGINKQIRNTSILSALKIDQTTHNMTKNRKTSIGGFLKVKNDNSIKQQTKRTLSLQKFVN